MNFKYKIIKKDWYKRRSCEKKEELEIQSIYIPNLKKEHDYLCEMFVKYKNGKEKKLRSRVIYNELNDYWTVDGMHVSIILLD